MDKKKIVIVIVVFLLLGTMVFSFANPRTEDEQLEGNDPSTGEQGGNQDDDQDDDETQGNEDDDQTDDDQQGDDTPVVGDDDTDEQTTDYLFLAQQAVEKAEQSLAQGDVTAANDAIQDVIENANEDVSDLQDRIETVQNIIDFEKLLTQLENKTNGTTNKDELDVVRNDKETKTTTTTLDNLVENLANVETNADKITNLTNRYNTVLAKLNDTTRPSVSGINNGEYTKGPVSLTITNEASFTATLNGENYVTGTEIPEEGNYTLTVVDASFNKTVITFTIDKTSPKLGAANILVSGDVNEQEVFYATNGDKINAYVRFNEELKHNPTFTLINNGKEYVIADEDVVVRSFDDGQYEYSILFEITKDIDMTDGEITMLVSNIEDLAGNEYEDITKPSNGHRVYLDRTLEYDTLGIAENDPDENPKYVTNGDSIRVLVYFKEELAVLPKVKINGVEYDTHYASQSSQPNNNSYAYHLDLPITKELNLPQGAINFEVYGYEDKAGNKGATLTNKDITYEQYDFVIYDSNKSEIKVDNLNELGYTNNGNVTITDNNSFNVVVKINGKEKHRYSGDKYKRADLSFLGEGKYEIIVTDAAGNESTIEFTLDKTLPKLGAANIKLLNDSNNDRIYYATNGDVVATYVTFNEELKHNPTFTLINNGKKYVVADENITVTVLNDGQYRYLATFEITEDVDMIDGEITMLVSNIEDLAGNKYQDINKPTNGHIVYLDRTLEFNINNIVNGYMNSVPYIGMEDASPFTVVVTSNDKVIDNRPSTEGTDAYYAAFQLFNLADGKYEVTATDAAGNSKTIVFIYDTTLAARVYSTVDFDGTGITPKVEGTRKTYYVNNGTSFVFRMQFTEQLSENPILNVGNKTVELELVEKFVTNEGKYIYQGTVEINEEDNFADGSLPLILSNVKDLAGNVTLDEAVLNQTITSNDRTIVIDNTPSTAKPLYILARDDASYRLSISDGEYLRVEANFNEELSKKPILTVGSQSIEFDRCNFNSDETRYVCVADIKIDNSIARLVEGENIPFTVTNIYDLAGNPSEFNNDDVTDYYRDDELVYSNVKFENPFVSMSFHNSTNYKLNEENNNTDLSVTEAKVGDTVRVFVRFNQDINIENFKPIIVIGGVAKELNLSNIYNDGTKDYGADITITKEMNLKLNEEIPFVIKNIVLKNGNNLPNLNQDDITSTNLSGVIYIGE